MVDVSVEGPRRARAPRGSGDRLRDEILDAATDLLLETGHARLMSIRSVAQRVGVTPPSIYRHFADKEALLDGVCARYFEKLDSDMRRAAAEHTCPVERFAVGHRSSTGWTTGSVGLTTRPKSPCNCGARRTGWRLW